jgi:hypothetical protein
MTRTVLSLTALALLATTGCENGGPSAPRNFAPAHLEKLETRHSSLATPDAFFDAYQRAFVAGDIATIGRLYAPDFTFVVDSLWCDSCGDDNTWGHTEEMQGIRNMCDPTWGAYPVRERRFSYFVVSTIDSASYLKLSTRLEYICISDDMAFYGNSGFTVLLREGHRGDLQMVELREHYLGADRAVPACYSDFRCRFYPGLTN